MLFDKTQIGTLELRNRLVRSATAEMMADETGRPLPELIELYQELARGGVGLLITGHMYVHPSGKAHSGMTGVFSDEQISGLTQLANAVHAEGGTVAMQINHAGRQSRGGTVDDPIGPSEHQSVPPRSGAREMTVDEIEMLIDAFAQAARRAKEAGFDAVQIHAAHGYLVSQFLSPIANQRNDEWGESLENRSRFLRRIIAAVRALVGTEYPILTKLGIRDESEEGLSLEEGGVPCRTTSWVGIGRCRNLRRTGRDRHVQYCWGYWTGAKRSVLPIVGAICK